MNQNLEFNILRRAQDKTKATNSLDYFFNERGIDINLVRKNPEYYEELIMQYSRDCISQELFKESKERMEEVFKRLCEFHRRNEDYLVEKFYVITKSMIKEGIEHQHLRAQ